MSDELIVKWLHRVLEEKCVELNRLVKRISTLNHQIQYYPQLLPTSKDNTIQELMYDMSFYDWKDNVKEIKSKLADKE